ncbi:MAG: family signal peptidase [Rhodospirillales bacterium]|nr:family signal peptidase [Rhodospirillales bacterium]
MYRRALLAASGIALAALTASGLARPAPRLIWNPSASAPVGLYWLAARSPIRRGDLVLANPPDAARGLAAARGYLPAGVPVVKQVAAMAGDRVCRIGTDLWVEGRIAARSLPADRQGRPLPVWTECRALGHDEVLLLMAAVPDSFDGRYFGPVDADRILGQLVPLWTR